MRVLIGCAYSDVERDEFRKRGHDAWSCDLLPSENGSPFHIQGDVRNVLDDGWDLGIFHPDCTFLTCSAAWAFGDGHDASKATGLWLDELPKLIPTKHVAPRMVAGLPRWGNQTDGGQNKLTPGPDRWKERARTYDGWAAAMAEQWGCL
jgi:hypothetical protein